MFGRYEAPESDSSDESYSSSDSGSSSSSSECVINKKNATPLETKMRNLSLNHLLSMEVGEHGDSTEAASNGKSRTRIQEAFKKPCCRSRCKQNLSFKVVMTFCVAFWSLSKSGQDSLSLQRIWQDFA